ncbi:MAG: TolC family protein [Chitinophagaceae bacterium]
MSFRITLSLLILALLNTPAAAQQKWNLLQCVQYAMDSSISVKQSQVQELVAGINHKQSKLSKYPNANFSNNDGYRFGKSQNPSTGILESQNFFSVGLNFQTSVEIFNWYSKRNTILANQWEMQAAKAGTDKLKNDLALTVANAYLQILLAKAQVQIAEVQLSQSAIQFNTINKQVKAGALPELNSVELEAQVARDSANLISAKGNVEQTKLVLKSIMNLDAAVPFEIEDAGADKIVVEKISDLQPEYVYSLALKNLPEQRIHDYRIKAAEKNSLAAKGALYPTISGYGSLGSNYGYFRTPTFSQVFSGYQPSGLVISNGAGGFTDVQRPVFTQGAKSGFFTSDKLSTQLNDNFGQSIGINISVPIFNGWSARAGYARSKLNIATLVLQKELDDKTIKQDIYQAYNAAVVALEKFSSSKKSVDAAQKSFDYATKRFNIGMLSTLELTTNQNNLFRAKLEYVLNEFDYLFKMKVLEYYKGAGLKF